MRVLVGIVGAALIWLMLAEFFVAFLLPRRVKRDPRIARGIYRAIWRPWRAGAARWLSPVLADTVLGFYGPFALLLELVVWALGLMIGFACVEWAGGGAFSLAFSAATFLSATFAPRDTWHRAVGLAEAATGVGVLFIVIGYLPSVYGAFSRREVAVSQLSARAGSPPSAGALLRRASDRGRWDELRLYLHDAETWAAEMMETHLSYPLLAYYRSQHVGQNWLAALTTIVDTSAIVVAALEEGAAEAGDAELTFAIGRHALADLAHQSGAKPAAATRALGDVELAELRALLEAGDLPLVDEETWRSRLEAMRRTYEPKAAALAHELALRLPGWLPDEAARVPRKSLPAHLR
jgi:hypothetical protein